MTGPGSHGGANRADKGARAYLAGLAAEEQVERRYLAQGCQLAARRWRGSIGEIDLIFRQGDLLIFVEVKQSASFATAAEHLTAAQQQRIWRTASEYLADEPGGQDSLVRLDVALVDGQGRIEVIEQAIDG